MKKNQLQTKLLILLFIAGLCLLLYPGISNYWNSFRQSTAINHYFKIAGEIDEKECERIIKEAKEYNVSLTERDNPYALTHTQEELYPDLLNISEDGMIGIVDIPGIGVTLPIYHGTSATVLQKAIGHLEWTSLPVGGENSHCVLSGHRGLPSRKLFTDLDKIVEGDVIYLKVLNEALAYKVDQILIVLPEDLTPLEIINGEDYCTLVTCTPYGVNTHRILIRGHRIENPEDDLLTSVAADAVIIEPLLVAPILFAGILLILIIVSVIIPKRKKRSEETENEE